MFTKIYEPKNEIDTKSYFTLSQFLKKAPSTNFGRFAIYIGLINLATNFAGPFFAVYMLKNLGYSYFWFIMIGVSGSLFTILSMPLWGKIGDYYGNRKLLWIGAILIPFAPLPWLISGDPIFLIFTAQVIAGFGWGAFNLAASNFIYDAVTPQRRAICVAYYTVINGVCIFLGAFMGGLFAEYISVGWINTLLLIFVISAILRALISIIMLPTIKEVRDIPKNQPGLSFNQYAYLLTPRPLFDMFRGFKGLLVGAHHLQRGGKSL
jgi:MFS family permease